MRCGFRRNLVSNILLIAVCDRKLVHDLHGCKTVALVNMRAFHKSFCVVLSIHPDSHDARHKKTVLQVHMMTVSREHHSGNVSHCNEDRKNVYHNLASMALNTPSLNHTLVCHTLNVRDDILASTEHCSLCSSHLPNDMNHPLHLDSFEFSMAYYSLVSMMSMNHCCYFPWNSSEYRFPCTCSRALHRDCLV